MIIEHMKTDWEMTDDHEKGKQSSIEPTDCKRPYSVVSQYTSHGIS